MMYKTVIDLHLAVVALLAVGLLRGGRTLWLALFMGSALAGASAGLVLFIPGDPTGKATFDLGLALLLWLCGMVVKDK